MDSNELKKANEMFTSAWQFYKKHCDPPVSRDPDVNAAWWTQATEDLKALVTKYNQHPLMDELLMTVYCYLSRENS